MTNLLDHDEPDLQDLFDLYLDQLGGVLLRCNGKRPIATAWSRARDHLDRARDAMGGWSGNVGLLAGDGLAIIDVDSYKPEGAASYETLTSLLPDETPTEITGRGGLAIFVKYDPSVWHVPTGAPFPGIEIRGEGGQQIVWPSHHPDTGARYEWEASSRPGEVAVAVASDELLEAIGGRRIDATGSAGGPRGRWAPVNRDALLHADLVALEALEGLGGHSAYLSHDGAVMVTRPGKVAGASASIGYLGPGVVKVFTSNWAHLPTGVYTADTLAERVTQVTGEKGEKGEKGGDTAHSAHTAHPPIELPDGVRAWDPDRDVPVGIRPPELDPGSVVGLPARFIDIVGEQTESSTASLLSQYLIVMGSVIGRRAGCWIEANRHGTNEFLVLCGPTGRGRKGTSLAWIERVASMVDPAWHATRIISGLGSGEALIHEVRDAMTDDEGEVVDPGVTDKRLLVVEGEFSQVMRVAQRERSILSEQLRNAWDGRPLRNVVKGSPARASQHHVSLLGHVTAEELRVVMNETSIANGLGNRFLYCWTERARYLPLGGNVDPVALQAHAHDVTETIRRLGDDTTLDFDDEARDWWVDEVYRVLVDHRPPGLVGALFGRAEAHVRRLGLIYAALDPNATAVTAEHLDAALSLWRYLEATILHIFGDRLGDPVADRMLAVLRDVGVAGLARNDLFIDVVGHHDRSRAEAALEQLVKNQLVVVGKKATAGRPAETVVAVTR